MNKELREDVSSVPMGFAAVLTEEIAVKIGASWEWKTYVVGRISPIISRLREGKSLEPSEAHKGHD